jgi:adenine-specific DNA-methyltransferase
VNFRYMGTKRGLAPAVVELSGALTRDQKGPFADIFAGMGAVATHVGAHRPVIVNDVMAFASGMSAARFLASNRRPTNHVASAIYPHYQLAYAALSQRWRHRLRVERQAIAGGDASLLTYQLTCPHVGTSARLRLTAQNASIEPTDSIDRYVLATTYFSGGYFSTQQAVSIDALRFAIECSGRPEERPWLLGALLLAAATVINAPGHSAQFLKSTSPSMHTRVKRFWSRSIWPVFIDALDALQPIGPISIRRKNVITNMDAISALRSGIQPTPAVIYADPPYTKDQYSRYYHVFETLYLYDFPASTGAGRYRDNRFVSNFSIKSRVLGAFEELCAAVAQLGRPMILSYPDNGLLCQTGVQTIDLLNNFFAVKSVSSITINHSSLGGSSGSPSKEAKENIYVCAVR